MILANNTADYIGFTLLGVAALCFIAAVTFFVLWTQRTDSKYEAHMAISMVSACVVFILACIIGVNWGEKDKAPVKPTTQTQDTVVANKPIVINNGNCTITVTVNGNTTNVVSNGC